MLADVLTASASWQAEHPLLTYLVPEEFQADLRAGQLVAIPYGKQLVEGIVWTISQDETPLFTSEDEVLRPLNAILDIEPARMDGGLLRHPAGVRRAYDASPWPDAALTGCPASG